MILRPYQNKCVDDLREQFREHRSVMLQLGTGAGKTAIVAQIVFNALAKGKRIWFIVPRNELLTQASNHFKHWGIPHNFINAKSQESKAYKVHIVSKMTLIRRYDKIKNQPDVCIFDEGHIGLDSQKEIASLLPETSLILAVTATPELLSGMGLGRKGKLVFDENKTVPADTNCPNGLYESIVYGPTLQDLVEMGYLSNVKYFCPPLPGLDKVHRKGTEYDQDELEALLQERQVYGDAIKHYKQYADGEKCLVFCRSVKAAEETAHKFCAAGYRFENIDGRMPAKKREAILKAFKDGELQGLTSCEILCYGYDAPAVACLIMLRPTLSKALFFQMVGRGLRPFEGKEACVILDHVGLLSTHLHPLSPYNWNFYGKNKAQKPKGESEAALKICEKCFMYFSESECPNCGTTKTPQQRKDIKVVDGRLVEIKAPVKLNERDSVDRKEFQDRIAVNIDNFGNSRAAGEYCLHSIKELLKIAKELGRQPTWVYWQLTECEKVVDVPLLTAIRRAGGYKDGWFYFKKKEIVKRLGR